MFHKDLSTTPLKGSPSLHEAEVGGVSPTASFSPPFSSVDAAAQFYRNRIFNVLRHQAEVGGSPRLKRLRLIFLRSMPPPSSYNNRIFKVSRHQAEAGGFSPTEAIARHI